MPKSKKNNQFTNVLKKLKKRCAYFVPALFLLASLIKKRVQKNAPLVLMTVGVFFMLASASHWILSARALSMESNLVAKYQEQQVETPITPTHLYIQWFVDTEIEPHVYQNNQWTTSTEKASYLSQSAQPGSNGNIIIYGHNTRSILGNIRALKGSETITLTLSDGTTREYQIQTITEVSPTQTTFLEPTETETLTLYTCSGFLDKNRFIVQAIPTDTQSN